MSEETKTMIDGNGQSVPAKYVKPYDRARDRIARRNAVASDGLLADESKGETK